MRGGRRLREVKWSCWGAVLLTTAGLATAEESPLAEEAVPQFRAGAFAIDVTPTELPVIINGSMREHTSSKIVDRLHARCLVLDDSREQIAIVVVDSCMMPRSLLDEAKQLASEATGLRPDRILISATHTHAAPSVMPVLGSRRDEKYAAFLPRQIAKGIEQAFARLAPARIGWAIGRDETNVACRRWLMKPGALGPNPFGETGERANMHPGFDNPNAIRPTGQVDPEVAVLSVQTAAGRPLALLANYSMHYVGGPAVSADYFGQFCEEIAQLIETPAGEHPFVAMISNGTSGDAWCQDYAKPKRRFDRRSVARDVAQAAFEAYQTIEYHEWTPLVMKERLLELPVRMPTEEDAEQAQTIRRRAEEEGVEAVGVLPWVYAGETLAMREMPPTRELKLQALRIGDLGITAIPNEVFSSTGLGIKKQSPLKTTFNISLANGAEGYIPPPDQHALGGYTTWRARSSCLEVEAEPKISEAVLELLGEVAAVEVADEPQASTPAVPSPLSPEESLEYFHLHDDFRIELVAAEPLVVDPVAYDWGPDGRLWVVEMGDYPTGLDDAGQPGGRIRVLEDTDDDGQYDRETLFAEGLSFPNGITVWRDGVLVTAAPDILYLADSDGDGRADQRQTLYTGVSQGNPQLRLNGLRWGLDGWLYCGNGMSTVDEVRSLKTGRTLSLRGRDVRIRPDQGELDAQVGMSQYGRTRDDWGNWFGVSNNRPIWHFTLADQYLRRNPHVPPPGGQRDLWTATDWRTIYPRSEKSVFFHPSEVGRFTSANSTIIYRDELFGSEAASHWFVSEPTHNLVHREVMSPEGISFLTRRVPEEERAEFLASEDTWFRPNMLRTGPDGALWIADMYRQIIDHPQYIPADQHARLNFRRGDDRGRIYRVLPRGMKARSVPTLTGLDDHELAALLASPNGTLRDMVQKQLVWDERTGAGEQLVALAAGGERPATRLQALWTLKGLNLLTPDVVATAFSDPHPLVRRGGIRLAEGMFDSDPGLSAQLVELVDDPDPRVRLQLACTLGETNAPEAGRALAELALADADEPAIAAAIVSSANPQNVGRVLSGMLDGMPEKSPLLVSKLLISAVGYGEIDAATAALAEVVAPPAKNRSYEPWQLTTLADFCERLRGQKRFLATLLPADAPVYERVQQFFAALPATIENPDAPYAMRLEATRLLGEPSGSTGAPQLLSRLLEPRQPAAIQLAAVKAIARRGGAGAAEQLLAGWSGYSPQVRDAAVDVLIGKTEWALTLLDAIEQGVVAYNGLDATKRRRLADHRSEEVRQRVAGLSEGALDQDRRALVDQWQAALQLQGDPAQGALVFQKHCATCHRLQGQGHEVGPDLAALSDKSPAFLLESILDPSRSVDARFLNYAAATDEGRTYAGILVQESAASITLLGPDGKRAELMRERLEALECTNQSMMPDGLERDVTPQQLADLIAYVAQQ